ncbi:hypothetical protein BST45_11210 [Mycobacterium shinjukuense]|nr:hypothetical protein BST45_11210 [Mycobacterium shinjukuense]
MTLCHRAFHPVRWGQWMSRCSIDVRAEAAKRAGMLTRSRRRVDQRATARWPPTQGPGGARQGMSDHRAGQPGAVGRDLPDGIMCQWAVDRIGAGGFDDGVAAVGG